MSGILVIVFWLMLFFDLVFGITTIGKTGEHWLNCVLGITMLAGCVGCGILLGGWKLGGMIMIVAGVIFAACSFVPDTVLSEDNVGFWFGLLHIALALITMFGPRRHYLN